MNQPINCVETSLLLLLLLALCLLTIIVVLLENEVTLNYCFLILCPLPHSILHDDMIYLKGC